MQTENCFRCLFGMDFPTDFAAISAKIDEINPKKYASTRNYIDGAVSKLSPYISRGVISTKSVLMRLIENGFGAEECLKFAQELAWRDYFQILGIHKPDIALGNSTEDESVLDNRLIPLAIIEANTGIQAIDESISHLYATGYLHNHLRMYLASITCNIAQGHWLPASKWLYYNLLDADFASNACSWQWVAGLFSKKKYYANQENISKYTHSKQKRSYLDVSYDQFPLGEVPQSLLPKSEPDLTPFFPELENASITEGEKLLIYNFYNLDPMWLAELDDYTRVFLIEPDHFEKYPVNKKVMHFAIELSKNIKSIQYYTGSFESLLALSKPSEVHYKSHPLFPHYKGIAHERDFLFPDCKGYFPSFFNYWRKCEKSYYQLRWRK